MRKTLLFLLLGVLGLCLATAAVLAFTNRNLPKQSSAIDRLSEVEKAHLEEYFHLRQTLGERVWSGWSQSLIPIIVYNESYAFLVGYPGEPPAGWKKVPEMTPRGTTWEVVPDDSFLGQAYYRQALTDPNITPEAFTVLVGETWVATLGTHQYAEISFYQGFHTDLPGFVQPFFPYRQAWKLLMGDSDVYLGALEHEAFHAFQGIIAPDKLALAERANSLESRYPWETQQLENIWKKELELLYQAATAETSQSAIEFIRQFLAQRQLRRHTPGMTGEFARFEQLREWEEGLAKYAELEIIRLAALTSDYAFTPGLANDPNFRNYSHSLRFYQQQLTEGKRLTNRSGDTRFYYSGFLQAVVLDRLLPDWKALAFQTDVWLDELLSQAIGVQE